MKEKQNGLNPPKSVQPNKMKGGFNPPKTTQPQPQPNPNTKK